MDLIRVPEAAAAAGVTENTIRNYLKNKRLTEYRRTGRVFVDRSELLQVFGIRRPTPARSEEQQRIIAVANQKGGTGKTTTAVSLATLLAREGNRVLAIDCDPQGNMTQSFGLDPDDQETTLYNVLVDEMPLKNALIELSPKVPNVTLVPANLDLADTSRRVTGRVGLEVLLKNAMLPHLGDFAYVVLDCPPSLDMITINALVAASEVIVPVDMSVFSVRGMVKLMATMQEVRKVNPGLPQPRIVACRTDNTTVSQTIEDRIRQNFGSNVFSAAIPRAKDIAEAQTARTPLPIHAPRSKATVAYTALALEVRNG